MLLLSARLPLPLAAKIDTITNQGINTDAYLYCCY